jgi:hypothetical protein
MARVPTVDKRKNKDDELGPAAKVATSTLKPREGGSHVVPPASKASKPAGPPLAFEVKADPEATTKVVVQTTNLAPASSEAAARGEFVMLDRWCAACCAGLWETTMPGGRAVTVCRNLSCAFVKAAKPGEEPLSLNFEQAVEELCAHDARGGDIEKDILAPHWLRDAAAWLDCTEDAINGSAAYTAALNEASALGLELHDPKTGGPIEIGLKTGAPFDRLREVIQQFTAGPVVERTDGAKTWPGNLEAVLAAVGLYPPTAQPTLAEAQHRILGPTQEAQKLDLYAPDPIPMLLWCPSCCERHIDTGSFATESHHTHACQACGMVWRPAVVATVGVQFLPGFKNEGWRGEP